MDRGTIIKVLMAAGAMSACGLGMADLPWPMWRHDMGRTGQSQYSGPIDTVELAWSYDNLCNPPVIGDDGTIYVTGIYESSMLVYALNSDGGGCSWTYPTGTVEYPAVGSDRTVYASSYDNVFYAINSSGTLKWSLILSDTVEESPAIGSDGKIYLGANDGTLYVLNSDGIIAWSYICDESSLKSPAIGPDGMICVSDATKLYALNSTGGKLWYYPVGGGSSSAIGTDGRVYADGAVLQVLESNGRLAWSYLGRYNGYSYGTASPPSVVAYGVVYLGLAEAGSVDKLYSFTSNGHLYWSYVTDGRIYSAPTIGSDGMIYAGSHSNRLFAFFPHGQLVWSYDTGEDMYGPPAIGSDGRLYAGSISGTFYVLSEVPTETPTPSPTPTAPPTATPTITPPPTVTATALPTVTPTLPGPTPTVAPSSALKLSPNMTTVGTGDFFTMRMTVGEAVVSVGPLALYVVLNTPGGSWFSFVPKAGGGFALVGGIKPAAVTGRIPVLEANIFSGTIGSGLARGGYWFCAAIFEAGSKITLDNWRSQAIHYSEVTVTVR